MNPLNALAGRCLQPLGHFSGTFCAHRVSDCPSAISGETKAVKVGRHDVRISNPDKPFFPERGLTKGDLVAVLPRRRRVRAAASAAPSLPHEALPERRRGRLLPPEARAAAPGVRRRAVRAVPERAQHGVRGDRQRGCARVGDQPRLHRAAHVALAHRRHRASRLPADRPRPDGRRAVAVRARDRARRSGRDAGARARVVSEDVRRDGAAHPGADQAGAARSRTCADSRRRSPRRSSGASATRTSRRRRGASRTAPACSSTSDRTRATARSRARTRCGRRRMRASRRRLRWDEVAGVEPEAFTIETMRARIADVGDPMRGMWRRRPSLVSRFAKLGLEAPQP